MKNRKMGKIKSIAVLLTALVITASFGRTAAMAATKQVPASFAEITYRDDVLVMDKDTETYDEVWLLAGVTDPKSQINEFETMGVQALFFDPSSKQTVSFITKTSSETYDIFSFAGKSDAEIIELTGGLITSEQEGTKIDISNYECGGIPYFRMALIMDTVESQASEIVYGTVANATLYTFHSYQNGTELPDETLCREIMGGFKLTAQMTPEEYEAEKRSAIITLVVFVASIVLVIVGLVMLSRYRKKKTKARNARISAAMQSFREREKNGEINTELRISNETVYDDDLTQNFSLYHLWIKDVIVLAICVIAVSVFFVYMLSAGSWIYAFLIAGLTAVFLYQRGVSVEKKKKSLDVRYAVKQKKTALFRFYDEYLTMSGIDSISTTCYAQITSIKKYKKYIYLYTGTEHALILDSEGFADGKTADDLVKLTEGKTFRK